MFSRLVTRFFTKMRIDDKLQIRAPHCQSEVAMFPSVIFEAPSVEPKYIFIIYSV